MFKLSTSESQKENLKTFNIMKKQSENPSPKSKS